MTSIHYHLNFKSLLFKLQFPIICPSNNHYFVLKSLLFALRIPIFCFQCDCFSSLFYQNYGQTIMERFCLSFRRKKLVEQSFEQTSAKKWLVLALRIAHFLLYLQRLSRTTNITVITLWKNILFRCIMFRCKNMIELKS